MAGVGEEGCEPDAPEGGHVDAFAEDVAASLRTLRASRGLSQRGLAEASGVSKSAVARVEAGSLPPAVARWLTTICALGLDLTVAPRSDADGRVVPPPHRDAAGRHFPAHARAQWRSMPPTWWFVRNGGWGTKVAEPEWFWRHRP